VRWVSIKRALSHDASTGLVQHHHVDPSPLVHFSILQNLASYTNIKFLSSQIIILIARKASSYAKNCIPTLREQLATTKMC
jgi:hypothetical protein